MKSMEHQNVMILLTSKSFILLHTQFPILQIVSYFVTRQVSDTRLCGDFKAINKSAMNLSAVVTFNKLKYTIQ